MFLCGRNHGPHQCWVEGKYHPSWPAGNTLLTASQNIISLLSSKGTLLVYIQLGVHQDSEAFLCRSGWPVACSGACIFISPEAQDSISHWTPWGFCLPTSPACQCPSGWQHGTLVCQALPPVLCHLEIYCGCTLHHHPGKSYQSRYLSFLISPLFLSCASPLCIELVFKTLLNVSLHVPRQ